MSFNYWKDVLPRAGYELACEVRDGKWDHMPDTPARGLELIAELRRRVPGRPDQEYQDALSKAFQGSR